MTVALVHRRRLGDLATRAFRWRPRRGWYRPKLTWLAPLLPFVLIVFGAFTGVGLPKIVGGLIGIALLWGLSKRPVWCALAAVPVVTLQQVGLPLLWSLGMPGQVARQLGALKDVLGLALVVAAVAEIRREPRKLDPIDKLALGYIGIVFVNLIAPQLFSPLLPATFSTRLLAFRYDAGYVLLFLSLRHIRFPADMRERFVRAMLGLAAVIVAGGLWERFAASNFDNFILNTAHFVDYSVQVMGQPGYQVAPTVQFLGQRPVHVGSFILSPHNMCDFLLVAFAFILERAARAHRWRSAIVAFVLIGVTMVFAQVRADLLAAGVLMGLVLLPRQGRRAISRVGVVAMIGVAAVLVFPLAAHSRLLGGGNASTSNTAHKGEFALAVTLMSHHPLGIGLGNNPATGNRFQLSAAQQGALTGDNSWLQVGDELGVPALIVYTAMLVAIVMALIRRGREEAFPNAVLLAFVGIWVAGMFHHVFLSFPQAWALWSAVGLALPAAAVASRSSARGAALAPDTDRAEPTPPRSVQRV
jgi:hypothetical protein